MKKLLFLFTIFLFNAVSAQGIVKTMFYNVLNYPSAPPENREVILRTILTEYEPDIFMIAELETEVGGQEILDESLNFDGNYFAAAPFVENTSNDWNDEPLQQLLFYRTNTFNLVETAIVQTYLRDINMYKLQLISEDPDTEEVFFYIFIAHLKASDGAANEQDRLDMILDFTDYLENLPVDANVIFAGDFNFYSANEPAYAEVLNFTGDNNITFVDPIDQYGNWHNNSSYSGIHTQSTRLSNSGFENYGAGGGLDDRFDFILISENLTDENAPVHYIDGSYKAFGNNGNCFNSNINDSDCVGAYSATLREALYNMSDHLPVVMEIQTSQNLDVPKSIVSVEIELVSGNIVSDFLEIKIPAEMINSPLTVYDMMGKEILTITPKDSLSLRLNVSSLANGMYFAAFKNTKIAPVKFIKIN